MSDAPIRIFLDYLSSNAYLAWTQLPALAQRFGRAIEPVPVLFAGLLEAHGQMGPAEVLPKAWWMAKNNLRKAALLGVPLHPPAFHPFNPLLALRVTSLPMDTAARARLVGGLLRGVWAERRHVSDPSVVAQIASEAGLDGAALVAAAQQPEAKAALRKQTDDAIALGVFGVPTVIVDGELFFGFDDFPFLERFLAGGDPLDRSALAEWARPQRPSAMRRQHRERPPLRLAHLNLPARDPEALARWYADTFGLEARGAFVIGPGTLLAFERGDPLLAGGNAHFGFEVPSARDVAIWAQRFGSALDAAPRSASTRVRDPEGNGIEIYWEPDGPLPAAGSGIR
jgi:2-hydroxychromene-2-carboxylate isomerase/predicted enzyme related to lactoylglutathione lyase